MTETTIYLEKRLEDAERERDALAARVRELEKQIDDDERHALAVVDERDGAENALRETDLALGGTGEWAVRIPRPSPPESGDLRQDVPERARLLAARVAALEKRIGEEE